jgi:hypothetical protein
MLLIISNGPTVTAKEFCQWFCIDPESSRKNAGYYIEWAHNSCQDILLLASHWRTQNVIDDIEWAHSYYQEFCQWFQIDLESSRKITANNIEWAHHSY